MKNKNVPRLQAEQLSIPLPLPLIKGNKDYEMHKDLLERIDKLLVDSGVEAAMQNRTLMERAQASLKPLRASDQLRIQKWASQALRCHAERYRDLLAAKWQETDLTLHLAPCLERLQTAGIHIADVVGDRGFASAKNSRALEAKKIGDHLCPRKVVDLKKRLQEKKFATLQKRRAQTEARIGILKHNFIGATKPAKGFSRQKKHIAWSVLAHNLWLIARRLADQAALQKAA